MGGRGKTARILCVNCNICVNTLHRYPALELDIRVTTLLCNWVHPQIITEDDYVCEACRDLAMVRVNDNLQQEVAGNEGQQAGSERSTSHRGHTNVCLLCGCSTAIRRSDRILRDNPSELQQSIFNILQSRIPQQITVSDRVCHACWVRTQREALQMSLSHRSLPIPTEEMQEGQMSGSISSVKTNVLVDTNHPVEINRPVDTYRPMERNFPVDVKRIVLPNYRRAANTTAHCVFPNCHSATLHCISDKLRAIVLSNHNYYLPNQARLCAEHLTSNSWETLFDSENSMETFTTDQIQHVFSFVNAFNPTIDFENVQEMDDRVFEYWTGLTKEKFNTLLQEVPRLREIRRGSLGLASLLLKIKTGDSDDRISTLVRVPRRTLESLMDKVREVLIQDFVSENLEISNLRREELLQHNLALPNAIMEMVTMPS